MFSQQVKDVAKRIGEFYLHKNNNDYKKTGEEIEKLLITNLEFTDKGLTITAVRVGLLIGKRGQNIYELQTWLNIPLHIVEERDHLNNYMIPNEPDEFNDELDPYYNYRREQEHYEEDMYS